MPQTTPIHPSVAELQNHLLGKLDDAASAQIEEHLGTCRPCQEVLRKVPASDTFVDLIQEAATRVTVRQGLPPELAATTPPESAKSAGPELPPQFGRYRILRRLGKGGMGAVYLARDTKLDREVALKVPHLSPEDGPAALARFRREAQAMGEFRHPNLCPIYDVDEVGGVHFYTMPFIAGASLRDWIARNGLPAERQVAGLIRKLALALQVAHRHGVIHRDLKPGNVMIERTARGHEPIIVDFGLAFRSKEGDARLTQTGAAVGTLTYMPPEQLKGDADQMSASCDIYSLGATMYELLTGKAPFDKANWVALADDILHAEPPDPRSIRAEVDERLAQICRKCLAKKPRDRYASMQALADALGEFLRPRIAESPPPAESKAQAVFAEIASEGDRLSAVVPPAPPSALLTERAAMSRPTPSERTINISRRASLAIVALGSGALAVALLAAGIVLYVATNYGTIKIELSDPAADVQIKVDGDVVTLTSPERTLTLRPGKYEMEVAGDDFRTITRVLTLKRGVNPPIHITLEPKLPVAPPLAVAVAEAPHQLPQAFTENPTPPPVKEHVIKPVREHVILPAPAESEDWSLTEAMKRFEGTWEIVSGVKNGGSDSKEYLKIHRVIVRGERYELYAGSSLATTVRCKFVGRGDNYFHFDYITGSGQDERTHRGIMDFPDANTARRCLPIHATGERPTTFTGAAGTDQSLAVYKRVGTSVTAPAVPNDAATFGGHSYQFFGEQLTWKEANAKCAALGGYLAIIDSAEENKFVADLVAQGGMVDAWIGITDEAKEGEWRTVKGDRLVYTNWSVVGGQPNNKGGVEHYALISNRTFGKPLGWTWCDQPDRSLDHKPGYVCEWDAARQASRIPSPAPTPPTSGAAPKSVAETAKPASRGGENIAARASPDKDRTDADAPDFRLTLRIPGRPEQEFLSVRAALEALDALSDQLGPGHVCESTITIRDKERKFTTLGESRRGVKSMLLTALNDTGRKYGVAIIASVVQATIHGVHCQTKPPAEDDLLVFGLETVRFLEEFPPSVIQRAGLKRIVVCEKALFDGKESFEGGGTLNDTLVLFINDVPDNLRQGLHHELYHVFDYTTLRMHAAVDREWQALNPRGFVYGGYQGFFAADGRMKKEAFTHSAPEGFATIYATASVAEDKADTYAMMMVAPEAVAKRIEGDKLLRAKVALLERRLRLLGPQFTPGFWKTRR
jgi:serine/threonine protein kinase